MNKIKSLDIRLTDIWDESQKELKTLTNKCNHLKKCLEKSEKINKHLTKCNQTLVTIVEKCKIDYRENQKIMVLITIIKEEEESIKREKQILNNLKERNTTEDKCLKGFDLISEMSRYKRRKNLTEDKSVQTSDEDLIPEDVNIKSEINNDIKTEPIDESEHLIPSAVENLNGYQNINTDEIKLDFEDNSESLNGPTNDHNSQRSEDIDEVSSNFSDVFIDDESDSDYEEKSKRTRSPRKRKNKGQNSRSLNIVSKHTERINVVVMPFKVDDRYVCGEEGCDFISTVKREFYSHYIRHNQIGVHFLSCDQIGCDFKGFNYIELNSHKKEVHNLDSLSKNKRSVRISNRVMPHFKDNKYVCNETDCDYSSGSKKTFYSHLIEHDRQKCPLPKPEPIPKSNKGERPYDCDWPGCGMAFKCSDHLRMHKKRHMGQKDFKCDWPGCEVRVYTSYLMKSHRRIHTDERPLECDWPGCEYTCKQKWALVAHKRTHTGEKPYVCAFPECGYRCSQSCTLTSHNRKHTGEKPYICQIPGCNKRFSALAGIWSHKKSHKREEFKQTNEESQEVSAKKKRKTNKTDETKEIEDK